MHVVQETTTTLSTAIEQELQSEIGTETATARKQDASSRISRTKTVTGATVTHESGRPRIKLRKLG